MNTMLRVATTRSQLGLRIGVAMRRFESTGPSSKPPEKKTWLNRMAPPKGGTDPPDIRFMAVFAVVASAGFYAWFIDPPAPYQE
jgi:hypothetical protein